MTKYLSQKLMIAITTLIAACFIGGCKEDLGIGVNKIGEKPLPVSNITVTSISGGAYIKYDLPLSEDLRYVKATYKLDNGIEREAKASIYKNEILVDGFGEAGDYNIELRAVAVGEVASDPVTVNVNVLTPPHQLVLQKLSESGKIMETFGGFNLKYQNETASDIVIRILKKDSVGQWKLIHSEYTNLKEDVIKVRGVEAGLSDFGFFIEDRYDHFSDTLVRALNPTKEVLIPRDKFAQFKLPNDPKIRSTFPFVRIWDGNIGAGALTELQTLPIAFTIDVGIPVMISRMVTWTNYGSTAGGYGSAHIYDFELYGSNEPNPSGAWDSTWTLLGSFKGQRPSGLGFGVAPSQAERDYLRDNGETWELPSPEAFPKFRYIRLKVYATWNGAYEVPAEVYLNELYLYGQY
ncbi:DUF4959 domain-containing protein [Niabella hirudinis]|uniref:DUF4959 domain-containing protein n=1 Tax=Niabella hirudinis TaxID=1285929 RepID=UPI003EB9E28B